MGKQRSKPPYKKYPALTETQKANRPRMLPRWIREEIYNTIPPGYYPNKEVLKDYASDLIKGRRRVDSPEQLDSWYAKRALMEPKRDSIQAIYEPAYDSLYEAFLRDMPRLKGDQQVKYVDNYHSKRDSLNELRWAAHAELDHEDPEYDINAASGDWSRHDEELWRKYLGVETGNEVTIKKSKYKPTKSKDPNAEYFTIDEGADPYAKDARSNHRRRILNQAQFVAHGQLNYDTQQVSPLDDRGWKEKFNAGKQFPFVGRGSTGMARITIDRGEDEYGKYVSFYDKYDFDLPFSNHLAGKPFEIYDRIYYTEQEDGTWVEKTDQRNLVATTPPKKEVKIPNYKTMDFSNTKKSKTRKPMLSYALGGDPPGSRKTVAPSMATDTQRYAAMRKHQMPGLGRMSTFGELQDNIYESDMTEEEKAIAYEKLRNQYGERMKRLKAYYGSDVPEQYNAKISHVTGLKRKEFGKFADVMMPRVNYNQGYDDINPEGVRKPEMAFGGGLGMLSPLPNAVFPKRGLLPASPAFPKGGFETLGASNNMRDRRGRAGQLQSYAYGGELPEYNWGGALAGAGAGAKLGTTLGSFFPGAGNIIGGAIGAIGGGIAGWFKGKKEDEEKAAQKAKIEETQRAAKMTAKLNSDMSQIGTFPTMGVESSNYYAAYGGPIQPEYMAEGGETIVHNQEQPNAFTGALNQLSSNMSEIKGPSHASPQGGVEMEGGDFIFSKRMKATDELKSDLKDLVGYAPSDTTYAGISKSIAKKKGLLEEKLNSNDPIAVQTAEVMLGRLDEALELVALEQENRKNKRV